MIEHIKFPSIEQFRTIVRHVRDNAKYHGVPVPTVKFTGSAKLHGCFSESTPVTLANGERVNISEINVGDIVLSYNVDTGSYVPAEVTNTFTHVNDAPWVKLVFDDREIVCTENHKFYTNRGWVAANDLQTTDEFITQG